MGSSIFDFALAFEPDGDAAFFDEAEGMADGLSGWEVFERESVPPSRLVLVAHEDHIGILLDVIAEV